MADSPDEPEVTIDRPTAVLIRQLVGQGLSEEEVGIALTLPEGVVRTARFWRPSSKFSPAERARYRDLLRLAAHNLPYWAPDSDGRMELLPPDERRARLEERQAQHAERVKRGKLPPLP